MIGKQNLCLSFTDIYGHSQGYNEHFSKPLKKRFYKSFNIVKMIHEL